MSPPIRQRSYLDSPAVPTTSYTERNVGNDFSASQSLPPPPTTLSGQSPNPRVAKREFHAPNTVHSTFMPAPEKVVIDVGDSQSYPLQPPPTTASIQTHNDAVPRTYGTNSKREVTEDDLVQRINTLENTTLFQELVERAACKRQLAEMRAPDKTAMTEMIQSSYEDLLKAAKYANAYTFGEEIKQTWLTKIADARKTLETLAGQHQILLVQPTPQKAVQYPKINRIVGSIFAALALLFSACAALHYVIRKLRP